MIRLLVLLISLVLHLKHIDSFSVSQSYQQSHTLDGSVLWLSTAIDQEKAGRGESIKSGSLDDRSHSPSSLTPYYNLLSNHYLKNGRGKHIWWEIGCFEYKDSNVNVDSKKKRRPSRIRIGIQPHRSPAENGLTLVFHDYTTFEKLGFILLRHSILHGNENKLLSSMYGMFIPEEYRGLGLSSLFISLWISMCHDVSSEQNRIIYNTEIINKPLLAFVLQSKFGFVPSQKQGVDVQLIPYSSFHLPEKAQHNNDNNNTETSYVKPSHLSSSPSSSRFDFAMISPSGRNLKGAFSQRDLANQGLAILPTSTTSSILSSSTSRIHNYTFRVKTSFEHPSCSSSEINCTEKNNDIFQTIQSILVPSYPINNLCAEEERLISSCCDDIIVYKSSKENVRKALFDFLFI